MCMFKDHTGKVSIKRVIGTVIMLILLGSYLIDQLSASKMNYPAFATMLGIAAGLLGLDTIKRIIKE